MSFDIVKTINFPQVTFQYVPQEILGENAFEEFVTLGGILSDLKHIWHAKGPCLEVRNIAAGQKIGSWTFGGILKDSNTKIIAVDELKRPHGRLPLLVIALDCTISGGLICVFDIFGSKVLRVVQVREQITSLYVIDSGCENSVLPEPSPLRYFDGIVAIGTLGGNVYLLDICRQVCENGIQNVNTTIRDELNPCPMVILNKEKTNNIKKYVDRAVEREEHLAIHINVVLNPSTEHFTLKGENGEDRVHVNRSEAEVSSLYYSPQIASLLVGYNFGVFQLWDLRLLELVYTSPICEEHIPVMHFTVQEPADDPKAYCYIWVSYSHNLMFHSGLPFAVMYSFYYDTKNYISGYGNLYEDFQHCSIRFQIELGDTQTSTYKSRVKGGTCLGLQSLNKYPVNKDLNSLSLCLITWLLWNSHKEVNTNILVFDLNQWYKEQMPRVPNWSYCSNYIIKHSLNNQVLDVKLDQKSLTQFIGIQRLEEHFCPTSLSFDLWCISDNNVLKVHNKGLQQAFIDKLVEDQHLSLVRPEDYFEQISSLGLVPLFCEVHLNSSLDIDHQREMLLNVALEQKLVGWLCKCTSKLANNAFHASGLTIYNILNWAFERAINLKNSCDKYCIPLFDYSGTRLDNNTIALLNSSAGQIRNICSLYKYISSKLMHFISDKEALLEEQRSLENVVVYFEVLLWMVNIGLLPECHLNNYQRYDDSFMSAPYLVNDLTQYYNKKRAQLQMASHDSFVEKDCLLFIDNLINNKGGAAILRQQWQEDGGSGLYPPPSLQSVLRTYFLDGPDLVFKHCLVTYTLLDIARTVDENNKVIKLLLKFPQIFDLSQSNIKIVQAFWHLDHDDYETALEYILDPSVLTEDLHHWHHSVMMRSLLLQDQSNLALLYLQIRKPSIQDEKDLLTVISLLISKNMLDEAFKFRQQHQNPDEQALLLHIFNECNKNELLHSLLYRRLNSGEEIAFFKYLQSTKNPRCEDLKVFYYLLRSRFLEAFDSYSAIKRKKPENQGLIGQRDATTADNVVKMFKNLLPDVNKNLVELVRKERTNLWKEVKKPTPLSVFVHNAGDQVHYKSSVIFAALAKAKQTFSDTFNDTRTNNDVVTEETPFLRTPSVFSEISSVGTPLMKSKVIEQNEQGEEYGPSPSKRLKLSPRTSKTSPVKIRNLSLSSIQSKLNTPIIKRKKLDLESSNTTAVLPQSILKGSSASRTILDDSIFDENTSINTSLQLECENSIRRSRLALTPRKPVSRTPLKSHVKFDDLRYSGSSNEQSRNESTLHNLIPETSSRSQSANSTASTADEVFYSPDNSPEINEQNVAKEFDDKERKKKSLSPVRDKLSFDDSVVEDDVPMEEQSKTETKTTEIPMGDNDLSTNRLTFQSPRSRRSYKRSFGESPIPVRSSPRLAKKTSEEDKGDSISSEITLNKSESVVKPSPSIAIQKVRGRKSLSRTVLENNTFSKLGSSNIFEERKSSGNKSSISSPNTSATDFDSDVDMDHNDSIEELLKKYRASALSGDSPINKSDTLLFDTGKYVDAFSEGEIVSKTTEVQSVETRKESVRRNDTKEIVSSNETREEYHSKKVEVFERDEPGKGNTDDNNIFDEATKDFTVNNSKTSGDLAEDDPKYETEPSEASENRGENDGTQNSKIEEDLAEDDKKSETSEVSEKQSSLNEDDNVKTQDQSEINVYEDLSSGSDDVKEVLKQFNRKEDDGKVFADISFSTSLSYYQSEKKKLQMPENFMESGENSNDDIQKSPQFEHIYDNDVDMEEIYADIPDTEKAFIDSGDIIEIGSSSDEDDSVKEIKQITDESNQSSSSSSSSENKSRSSESESNEGNNLNIGFDHDLDEAAGQSKKADSDEEKGSDADDDFREEKITENIQIEEKLNEGSPGRNQKTEETLNDIYEVSEDSSSDDNTPNDIEQQFEIDRKEIADAVKMLQKDDTLAEEEQVVEKEIVDDVKMLQQEDALAKAQVIRKEIEDTVKMPQKEDALAEEQQVVEEDDKSMDSLILEPSPEKQVEDHLEPKIVQFIGNNENQDLTISEEQEAKDKKNKQVLVEQAMDTLEHKAKGVGDKNENQNVPRTEDKTQITDDSEKSPVEQDFVVENTESVVNEARVSEVKNSVSTEGPKSQSGVNIQLNTDRTTSQDNKTKTEIIVEEKEVSSSPQKESISLQCTLGTNDILTESVAEHYIQRNSDQTNLQDKESKAENVEVKKVSSSPQTESIGLQCTLGAKDVSTASVAEHYTNIQQNTDQTTPQDKESKTENVEDKEESSSLQKESKGLQCTLGANDTLIKSVTVDYTSVFLKDDEAMEVKKDQVTSEEETNKPGDVIEEVMSTTSKGLQCTLGYGISIMESSKEDDSVFLREDASKNEEESTPLVLRSVKKTYTKGKTTSETSETETVDLDATPKLAVSVTKRTYSKKDSSLNSKLLDSAESEQAETLEMPEDTQSDEKIEDKSEKVKESTEEASKELLIPMDVEEPNTISKDVGEQDKESVSEETSKEAPLKEQEEKIKESTEIGQDTSKLKNKEVAELTPSVRVTRRRSILMSQQEGTPSSSSETSISTSNSSGNTKDSKQAKNDSDIVELSSKSQMPENSMSQPSTSQSTTSQTPSSRRITRLSQLSDSMFDSTFVTSPNVVRAEIDIMETSVIDDKIKVRVERDELELSQEMEENKSPEGRRVSQSKSQSTGSSKRSVKSKPSTSKKQDSRIVFPTLPKKRTRSASVDQPSSHIGRKRSIRSKSIDLDDMKASDSDSKMDLRVTLTPILEQPGPSVEKEASDDEVPKHSSKAYSDVGAYTTTRRLTRRQANMLKTIGTAETETKRLPSVEEMDPLHLMDKSEFRGKPDPDEHKVFEQSSPSNSSGTPSRHTRSASVVSDAPSTPSKRLSKAKSEAVSSPISGIKSRLRKHSTDTMSVASEQSDSPSPPKRSKKKETESEVENDSPIVKSAKKGRSRTSSVSSIKSASSDKTDTSVRSTRSRRLQSTKSDLLEIKEEKGSDEGESMDTSVIKKRGRKKKD